MECNCNRSLVRRLLGRYTILLIHHMELLLRSEINPTRPVMLGSKQRLDRSTKVMRWRQQGLGPSTLVNLPAEPRIDGWLRPMRMG